MRITDRMIVNHTLNSLQQGRRRLGDAQMQVATGRRLLRPSDDPADVERALTLASELGAVQNQVTNLGVSRDWLSSTDQALSSFSDLMINARNLALRALNDTNSEDERNAMASQAQEMLGNALAIANSRHGDYYLFSGHQIRTMPFEQQGNTITYQGDNEEIRHLIELGQTMPVNITGVSGNSGGLLNALNRLLDFQQALADGDRAAIESFVQETDNINADLRSVQGTVGARMQRVARTSERLQQREVDLKGLYSQLVDADMAQTVAEMNAEGNAYDLSLAAAARAMPRSLLDFLR